LLAREMQNKSLDDLKGTLTDQEGASISMTWATLLGITERVS